jgi:hypothetical protein
MTKTEITNAIRSRFETQIADVLSLVTQYDNQSADKPDKVQWCRLTIITGETMQASIGNPSGQRFRTPGIMIAQIFCPIGAGDSGLWDLADSIESAFRCVTDTGVTFKTPYSTKIGKTGNEWQINVTCPFYADDIG